MNSNTYFTGKCRDCGYGVITQLDWDRYVPDVLDTGDTGACYLYYCTNKKCKKHKGEYAKQQPSWIETKKEQTLFLQNAHFLLEMNSYGTILNINGPFNTDQELTEAIEIGQAQNLFNPNNIYKTAKINDFFPETVTKDLKIKPECRIHELGISLENLAKNELLETEDAKTE